jgi:hydroxyethylthiazole kinase-like sugar kinase family protein
VKAWLETRQVLAQLVEWRGAGVPCALATVVRVRGSAYRHEGAKLVVAADGRHAVLRNGHPLMTRVTGVGCSASALVGAFAAVQPDAWRACTSAMAYWGVVGQIAAERMAPETGTGRYASTLLDVASTLTQAELAATLRAEAWA